MFEDKRSWKKIQLSEHFWSEGATFADLNKDGHNDIISGPYWWEGPDFKKRHTFYDDSRTFTRKKADGTDEKIPGFEGALGTKNTYSDNFFAYTHDFNGDGFPDILILGFPGQDASWFENPGKAGLGADKPWTRHKVFDMVDNESPTWGQLIPGGKPVIVCMSGGFIGYVQPNWEKPAEKWTFHPISPKGGYGKFTHGLGFGDVNGDGRMDILESNGWWEQPASLTGDPVWKFHPFRFAAGGAQMFAYDVNGDGRPDLITSLAAHGFGLVWWEQLAEKDAKGEPQFKQHVIINKEPNESRYGIKFSQLHAIDLVDMDGDGLKDIVTGKRYWAHGPQGDPDPAGTPYLYWFQLRRGADRLAAVVNSVPSIALGPIFLVLLSAVTVAVVFFMNVPLTVLHQNLYGSIDVFPLLAIPFFIYAGELMGRGTVAQRIVDDLKGFAIETDPGIGLEDDGGGHGGNQRMRTWDEGRSRWNRPRSGSTSAKRAPLASMLRS